MALKQDLETREQMVRRKELELQEKDRLIEQLRLDLQGQQQMVAELNKVSPANLNWNRRGSEMEKEIGSGGMRSKKRQKMKEQRATLAEVFGGEAFAKYFIIHFARENCKLQMCQFALEEKLSQKIGGRPKVISESRPSALQVETASKNQSERILEVKEILGEPRSVGKRH